MIFSGNGVVFEGNTFFSIFLASSLSADACDYFSGQLDYRNKQAVKRRTIINLTFKTLIPSFFLFCLTFSYFCRMSVLGGCVCCA